MLASLLQQASIPLTIIEADLDRHTRTQGGSLDIHADSGQLALKEAGLLSKFQAHMRVGGQAFQVIDINGNTLVASESEGRPEVDRTVLRDILLDSIDQANIKWNGKVSSIEPDHGKNSYTIHFADGSTLEDLTLVVGADGAWSKVRPLLTDVKPYYSGICGLDIWTHDVDTKTPHLAKLVGHGNCLSFADRNSLMAQRSGDGSIRTYAFLAADESWPDTCGIDWKDINRAKKRLQKALFGSGVPFPKHSYSTATMTACCVGYTCYLLASAGARDLASRVLVMRHI